MTFPTSTNTLTVQGVIDRVVRQFGDEANIQITPADVMRWINDAQRELALHNNLLQERGTLNVVAGTSEYPLPPSVLTLRSVRYNGVKIDGIGAVEAEERIDNFTDRGTPSLFWVWGARINLYPVPDTSITNGLQVFYTRQPALVETASAALELPPQYHNRVVEYCLQKAYELDENWDAAGQKEQQFQNGVRELKGNADWIERDFYPAITSLPEDYGDYHGW